MEEKLSENNHPVRDINEVRKAERVFRVYIPGDVEHLLNARKLRRVLDNIPDPVNELRKLRSIITND